MSQKSSCSLSIYPSLFAISQKFKGYAHSLCKSKINTSQQAVIRDLFFFPQNSPYPWEVSFLCGSLNHLTSCHKYNVRQRTLLACGCFFLLVKIDARQLDVLAIKKQEEIGEDPGWRTSCPFKSSCLRWNLPFPGDDCSLSILSAGLFCSYLVFFSI